MVNAKWLAGHSVLVLGVLAIGAGAAAETANLGAVYWNHANERWRDIATDPFASSQQSTYDYANAAVAVVYETSALTFTGTLTATGLKPNFAYQFKINGKPTYYWGDAGDDWANEQLGYAGRWWVSRIERASGNTVSGWNSSDAEYEQWKALGFTDGTYDYVFEGYLLLEYFVTGADGSASLSFALDSSFHVLWKTSQRTPHANDSTPTVHTVVASSSSPWYSQEYPATDVGIYAEWEPSRALPGQGGLPVGLYHVRIFLTEESFHETAANSGVWATVMAHDSVVFSVVPPNRPPVASGDRTATFYRTPVAVAVLANDTDPDGDALSVAAVTQGAGGSVVINSDETVAYTPWAGFSGTDFFTYTASDGRGGTATARVTVVVSPPNRPDIYGRVASRATGAGICRISLTLESRNGTGWTTVAMTTTNIWGAYAFTRLALGRYRLTPSSGRYTFGPKRRLVRIDRAFDHRRADFTAAWR